MNPLLIKDYLEIIIQHVNRNDLYSLLLINSQIRNVIGLSDVWKKHHVKRYCSDLEDESYLFEYVKPKKIFQDLMKIPECEFTGQIRSYYGDYYYLFRLTKWFSKFTLKIDKIKYIDHCNWNLNRLFMSLHQITLYNTYYNYFEISFERQVSLNKTHLKGIYEKIKEYLYISFQNNYGAYYICLKFQAEIYEFDIENHFDDDDESIIDINIHDKIKENYFNTRDDQYKSVQFFIDLSKKLNVDTISLVRVINTLCSSENDKYFDASFIFLNGYEHLLNP
jgi:hypothetical protein